jgi:hypothetical protein
VYRSQLSQQQETAIHNASSSSQPNTSWSCKRSTQEGSKTREETAFLSFARFASRHSHSEQGLYSISCIFCVCACLLPFKKKKQTRRFLRMFMLISLRSTSTMNPDKLKQLQQNVRIGGKGTARRKFKAPKRNAAVDDKKVQATLKRLGVNPISDIQEVLCSLTFCVFVFFFFWP